MCIVLLSACALAQPESDSTNAKSKGSHAFQNQDYATAYALWLPLAEAGDPEAQFGVAVIAGNGHGPFATQPAERRDATSVSWMRKAASQGFRPAAQWMADAYANGWSGLRADERRGECWRTVVAKELDPKTCD